MKKICVLLTFILALSLISLNVYAESNDIEVDYQKDKTVISLKDSVKNYTIFDSSGEILYKGKGTDVLIHNEEGSDLNFYSVLQTDKEFNQKYYSILQSVDNKESVSLLNLRNQKNEVSLEIDTSLTSIASTDSVYLDWADFPDVSEFKVYRDQELIDTVYESEYIDFDVAAETSYTYEVQFNLPMNSSEVEEVVSFFEDNNIKYTKEDLKKPVSFVRLVDTPSSKGDFAPMSTVNQSFSWEYKTFIPDQYVPTPIPLGNVRYFGGDNRSFSFTSNQVRTKMWSKTTFHSNHVSQFDFDKVVGATQAYDSNYRLIGSRTASDTFVNAIRNSHGSNRADYTYYHKVGNPYILGGNASGQEIDIQMRVITNRDGTYSFEGLHDRAPSHELYLIINNGESNRMIFAHPNEGFEYLGAPSALARQFKISGRS
ncbi:hypothetical protein M3212_18205 [Alkalihalobacillus oceani]|uniref:hypothetical protein n=1 Tax=Halalkalibacter oceani TaxID=1653776 RepID=UPI00203CC9A5|nr:hypothetical protein [Halalkalibacter oceani]MCM3762683.1 hypothetical protein [Halalkalibacter oceani]